MQHVNSHQKYSILGCLIHQSQGQTLLLYAVFWHLPSVSIYGSASNLARTNVYNILGICQESASLVLKLSLQNVYCYTCCHSLSRSLLASPFVSVCCYIPPFEMSHQTSHMKSIFLWYVFFMKTESYLCLSEESALFR